MYFDRKKKFFVLITLFAPFLLTGSLCYNDSGSFKASFYDPESYILNLRELTREDFARDFFNIDGQVRRVADGLRGSEGSFVIVGPLGSGKTEMIKRIAADPDGIFADKTPLLLDVVRLHDAVGLKSTSLNLDNLMRFVRGARDYYRQKLGGDVVMIIDNLQVLLEPGKGQGDAVKDMFEHGHLIALTTPDRFAKSGVAGDKAFRRRVRILQIVEPNHADTVALALRFAREIHQEKQISIPSALAKLAVNMAIVHIHRQAVPRTVTKMLDYAASQVTSGAGARVKEADMMLAIGIEARMQPREVRSAREKVARLDESSFNRIIDDRNIFNRMRVFEFNFDADRQYQEFRRNIRDGLARGSYASMESWSSL